jgi:oligoribonuclease (3'-5' exoribonuclease)
MSKDKALEILEYHQQYRQGVVDEMKYTPRQLTEALDVLIEFVKRNLPEKSYCTCPNSELEIDSQFAVYCHFCKAYINPPSLPDEQPE